MARLFVWRRMDFLNIWHFVKRWDIVRWWLNVGLYDCRLILVHIVLNCRRIQPCILYKLPKRILSLQIFNIRIHFHMICRQILVDRIQSFKNWLILLICIIYRKLLLNGLKLPFTHKISFFGTMETIDLVNVTIHHVWLHSLHVYHLRLSFLFGMQLLFTTSRSWLDFLETQ